MEYYYILFFLFCIVAYAIVVDKNVAIFIDLLFKIFKLELEKIWWKIKFHPQNPITNLIKRWEYEKIAKELIQEYHKDE